MLALELLWHDSRATLFLRRISLVPRPAFGERAGRSRFGQRGEKGTFYFVLTLRRSVVILLSMPRTARGSAANYCYHVLNRGNARAEVFHEPGDYDAFLELIDEAGA